MRTVATPWYGLSKFMLLVFGIPFSLVGVVIFFVQDGNWAFLINGIFWMIMGIGLKIKGASNQRKLEILKREGLCMTTTPIIALLSFFEEIMEFCLNRSYHK